MKFTSIIILIISLFISLFISLILLSQIYRTKYSNVFLFDVEDKNNKLDNETIYYEEKSDSYIDSFNKSKDFINDNINGILLNITKKEISKNIKVSVVIPCYNCKKYILSCIRSIQNQYYSNFEINIVNDDSTDDNLSYLYQLQKEEQRIKIISNEKKMGILYIQEV